MGALLWLLTALPGALAASCKNAAGEDVDWWAAYKFSDSDTALYVDANGVEDVLPDWLLYGDALTASPLWWTLPDLSEDNPPAFVAYGDKCVRDRVKRVEEDGVETWIREAVHPTCLTSDDTHARAGGKKVRDLFGFETAHEKGFLIQERAAGSKLAWISHSCPQFTGQRHDLPTNCEEAAQHFFCATFEPAGANVLLDLLKFVLVKDIFHVGVEDYEFFLGEPGDAMRNPRTKQEQIRTASGLLLRVAACGPDCARGLKHFPPPPPAVGAAAGAAGAAGSQRTGGGVRLNRAHCRLPERIARSPRYNGLQFYLRSWERDFEHRKDMIDRADADAEKCVEYALMGKQHRFPSIPCKVDGVELGGSVTTRGTEDRAPNLQEALFAWAKGPPPDAAAAAGGSQAEWKGKRSDHSKFMVSENGEVVCIFGINHYATRPGLALCIEGDAGPGMLFRRLLNPMGRAVLTPSDWFPERAERFRHRAINMGEESILKGGVSAKTVAGERALIEAENEALKARGAVSGRNMLISPLRGKPWPVVEYPDEPFDLCEMDSFDSMLLVPTPSSPGSPPAGLKAGDFVPEDEEAVKAHLDGEATRVPLAEIVRGAGPRRGAGAAAAAAALDVAAGAADGAPAVPDAEPEPSAKRRRRQPHRACKKLFFFKEVDHHDADTDDCSEFAVDNPLDPVVHAAVHLDQDTDAAARDEAQVPATDAPGFAHGVPLINPGGEFDQAVGPFHLRGSAAMAADAKEQVEGESATWEAADAAMMVLDRGAAWQGSRRLP